MLNYWKPEFENELCSLVNCNQDQSSWITTLLLLLHALKLFEPQRLLKCCADDLSDSINM